MRKVIIDTDPGVDDAIAILLALSARTEIEVLALTTVNGNVGLEHVTENALQILHLAGREDIPVYKGEARPLAGVNPHCERIHGEDGLGGVRISGVTKDTEKESAVEFLVRAAREKRDELTLLLIGPLTNIAKAIQMDPEFVSNVHEVIIMRGAIAGGNMSPHAEFNFWMDPEAAKIVFEAGFQQLTMIGLDATGYIWLNSDLRELLNQIGTPVSRFIHGITRVYVDAYWNTTRQIGCELCDALIPAYLLDPDVAEIRKAHVEIDTEGLCRGASVVYSPVQYPEKPINCQVAYRADTRRFFHIFFQYLFPDYLEVSDCYNSGQHPAN